MSQPAAERLTALDAFRGATIAFMVLVNTPGTGQAVYAPLRHARWHGWTLALMLACLELDRGPSPCSSCTGPS